MPDVKMFKAAGQTKRFRKNQKVWILYDFGNVMGVCFRWRGSGRYVTGMMRKHNNGWSAPNVAIGSTYDNFKTFDIAESFHKFLYSKWGK